MDISARDTALFFLLKNCGRISVFLAEPEKGETGVGDTPVSRYPVDVSELAGSTAFEDTSKRRGFGG